MPSRRALLLLLLPLLAAGGGRVPSDPAAAEDAAAAAVPRRLTSRELQAYASPGGCTLGLVVGTGGLPPGNRTRVSCARCSARLGSAEDASQLTPHLPPTASPYQVANQTRPTQAETQQWGCSNQNDEAAALDMSPDQVSPNRQK